MVCEQRCMFRHEASSCTKSKTNLGLPVPTGWVPLRKNCEYVRHCDSGSSQHGGRPRICLALVTLTLPRTDNLVARSLTLFVLTTEGHQISLLELVPQACRKTFWKNQVLLTIGWSLRKKLYRANFLTKDMSKRT